MIPQEWQKLSPAPPALAPGKEWHVFLSYRSINRGWVLNLYDVLTELGFKVFMDQFILKAGDSLVSALGIGLSKSRGGVLVWSNAAADSKWVENEYNVMFSKATEDDSFKFVPIRIDKTPLPAFVSSKLFMDFAEYPDGPNGGDLLRLVHSILGLPLSAAAVHFAYEQDEASGIALAKVSAAIRNNRPDKLVALYQAGGLPWLTTASLGCKAAEGLISLGEPGLAIDMLRSLLTHFRKAVRPNQLLALALARRAAVGDLDEAQDILGELFESGHRDPETLGIYARTWMDRYKISKKTIDLRQSRNYYAEAFDRSPDDYYTGINVAAKSVFLGTQDDIKKAEEYAAKTQALVGTEPTEGDYWKTATIGELFLIRKQYAEAARIYKEAVDMAPNAKGNHQSTLNQAILLMEKLGTPDSEKIEIVKAFVVE